jgi:surfeit locus 1 family protein
MRRPRWIGLLILALAVAAAFAALSQWQLARAIESGQVVSQDTEQSRPIDDVLKPATGIRETAAGQKIEAEGSWVPGDYLVVGNRVNHGEIGYWVTGHLQTDEAGLAVALGWTPDRQKAEDIAAALNTAPAGAPIGLVGRLTPPEGPVVPAASADPLDINAMSVAGLLGRWQNMDGAVVYTAFVVDDEAPAGMDRIDSPAPSQDVQLNWLNIFYAAEWVVFAGFAVFLWYRLAKDAWEREHEEYQDALAEAAGPDSGSADGPAAGPAGGSAAGSTPSPPRVD